jgi:hypothetical protein
MILVDSSVWIAYFNGAKTWQTELLDDLLNREPILIGDLILTEVLQGFRLDKDFKKAREFMNSLQFCNMGGYNTAIKAAQNYRSLRKKGVTVRKTIDVIIGTYCIENKTLILHDDQDFIPMKKHLGLKAVAPEHLH